MDNFVFDATHETPFDIMVCKTREVRDKSVKGSNTSYRVVEIQLTNLEADMTYVLPVLKNLYRKFHRTIRQVFSGYEDFEMCFLRGVRVATHADIKSELRFNDCYETVVSTIESYMPEKVGGKIKFNGEYI